MKCQSGRVIAEYELGGTMEAIYEMEKKCLNQFQMSAAVRIKLWRIFNWAYIGALFPLIVFSFLCGKAQP